MQTHTSHNNILRTAGVVIGSNEKTSGGWISLDHPPCPNYLVPVTGKTILEGRRKIRSKIVCIAGKPRTLVSPSTLFFAKQKYAIFSTLRVRAVQFRASHCGYFDVCSICYVHNLATETILMWSHWSKPEKCSNKPLFHRTRPNVSNRFKTFSRSRDFKILCNMYRASIDEIILLA